MIEFSSNVKADAGIDLGGHLGPHADGTRRFHAYTEGGEYVTTVRALDFIKALEIIHKRFRGQKLVIK